MSTESVRVSAVIPATPGRLYAAWLDAREHTAMTGGEATVEPRVGGRFTAWDGYIRGSTLTLERGRRIVQAWRSTDFPADHPDSRLEVLFEPVEGGTRITVLHADVPEGQGARYEQGWSDSYLEPMRRYFGREAAAAARAAASTAVRKPAKPAGGRGKPARRAARRRKPARAAGRGPARPAKRAAARRKPARAAAKRRRAAPRQTATRRPAAKRGRGRRRR